MEDKPIETNVVKLPHVQPPNHIALFYDIYIYIYI